MKRYAIWNKKDTIITPSGAVFTAEQWIDMYPAARLDHITVICAAGEVNGGFFSTLGQMVQMYEEEGCDFTDCNTPEQKLAAIEAFEDTKKARQMSEPSVEERIAAALEYQNMMAE